jgi:elongation factor 3
MVQPNDSKTAFKSTGGIKIIRANKPAAKTTAPQSTQSATADQLSNLNLNGNGTAAAAAAAIATSPTTESMWQQLISTQGSGPSAANAAAASLSTQLAAGDKGAAKATAGLFKDLGLPVLLQHNIITTIATGLSEECPPLVREAALIAFTDLAKCNSPQLEPYLLPLLSTILERSGDRIIPVRRLADASGRALIATINPHAAGACLAILTAVYSSAKKPQSKAAALLLIRDLANRAPSQLGHVMIDLIPLLTEGMVEIQEDVAKAAAEAMLASCRVAGNRDLDPHIPALVSCITHNDQVPDLIGKLSATTFVQTIEDAALAVMVPLLERALRERSTTVKRRATIIVTNMSKMVQDPVEATPFLPKLIPMLAKVKEEAADPELRETCTKAYDSLKAIEAAAAMQCESRGVPAEASDVAAVMTTILSKLTPDCATTTAATIKPVVDYCALLGASLIRSKIRLARNWEAAVVPYLLPHMGDTSAQEAARELQHWAITHMGLSHAGDEDDDEDAENELCNCEFSLGYGGRILLMNAILRLKRGHRYALCGRNGVGKTTLLTAINNGQVEGFPPKDVLRTVMVNHDIDASQAESSVLDYVISDPDLKDAQGRAVHVLESVGFGTAFRQRPVSSLSGGWKMKLALARAMLLNADILLLDEPTNHLDVENVAWLQNYLINSPEISCLIISHDSGFLDATCTDIIHYEERKLVLYKGNLSEFVKKKPEARTYYELDNATTLKFKFPEPGFLDGIKAKTQTILRLQKASYSYPGRSGKTLEDVNVRVTLGSRVAVLGANGAGKSTLIKMMTGETEADEGIVWKHPNLRISFVAQHAFHHIEQHLEQTPVNYLWWRYGGGEDKEAANKVTRKLTVAEQAERERAIAAGEKVIDYLNSRRMGKGKEYEYEVCYVNLGVEWNEWLPRSVLAERGHSKLVETMDSRAAVFLSYRPITTPAAIAHLADFGLEEEIASHNPIKGMSGGQKVKLVLAAALWSQPHLLVLDEPTNYLDRESLAALAAAIKDFQGACVMISHNSEFTSACCGEEWYVANGRVTVKGAPQLPGSVSMASLATVSSVASLASMSEMSAQSDECGDEELDEAALEARIKAKAAAREEKVAKAREKKEERDRMKKLKYSKRF